MYLPIQALAGTREILGLEELSLQVFVARTHVAILILPLVTGGIASPFGEVFVVELLVLKGNRLRPPSGGCLISWIGGGLVDTSSFLIDGRQRALHILEAIHFVHCAPVRDTRGLWKRRMMKAGEKMMEGDGRGKE